MRIVRVMNEFDDVEALLKPQKRSHLSLRALLRLYLDPFAFFKNANRGNLFNRSAAFRYNKQLRWILVPYMRRWLCIALACLLALNPAAALAQVDSLFLVTAVGPTRLTGEP